MTRTLDPHDGAPLADQPIPPVADTAAAIEREPSVVRRCLMVLGPGLTGGASNNDPSAIATYAQAGAALGLAPLWVAPALLPLTVTVVFATAKLAMVSGMGLAGVLRAHYPRAVLYGVVAALALANTFNAGADIGAVCAGVRLIFRLPDAVTPWLVFPVAFGILALQFWGSYRLITTTFKWLALALFAFVAAGVLARPDWGAVARATFVPRVDPGNGHYVSTLVAIVGTALSPYLYFWQASQRVEEERCVGRRTLWRRKGATDGELKYAWWDVAAGMFFSCLILYFIVLSTASTLHATGRTTVGTAADAAAALRPAAGAMAEALFAVGFLGAGLLAVPVLTTGAAYAACDAMGWRAGLNYRPGEAPAFYAVIAAATLAGALVNFLPMSPMRTLFVAAVINGLLAAPVLALVVLAGRHPVAMKDRRNGWGLTLMGWVTVAAAALAAGAFLASLV